MKTDNRNLDAKLEVRRHFLRKYHSQPGAVVRVLDCCQGDGLIWDRLRSEFPVASYWGVDVKPKRGRLAVKSERVLAQPGWRQDVIDVDTYGTPWTHWLAMLPNLKRGPFLRDDVSGVTVFLTLGRGVNAPVLSKIEVDALGLGDLSLKLTGSLSSLVTALSAMAPRYVLARASEHGLKVVEIAMTESKTGTTGGGGEYWGVRLEVDS